MNSSSYIRYLEAKRTIDERSINRRVWERFVTRLNLTGRHEAIKLMEIGAGTGYTLFKVLEAINHSFIEYTIIELERDHAANLIHKFQHWAAYKGGTMERQRDGNYIMRAPGIEVCIRMEVEDAVQYLTSSQERDGGTYDAIMGQAILDLLDIDRILPLMDNALKRGGLYYFSINFDGMTSFLPAYDAEIDQLVENIYHASMVHDGIDRSQTGRRVLMNLLQSKAHLLETGSSDWIVVPDAKGNYPGEESYFLAHILQLVRKELLNTSRIDHQLAVDWYKVRLDQVRQGHLVYIAHQLDILASSG